MDTGTKLNEGQFMELNDEQKWKEYNALLASLSLLETIISDKVRKEHGIN